MSYIFWKLLVQRLILAINEVFWSILRGVRILLTYCNRIVNKIWHHVIIACDSLIWLSVVWVDVPLWSEEAREEWEGQSSVSSKEAWTCHPLSEPPTWVVALREGTNTGSCSAFPLQDLTYNLTQSLVHQISGTGTIVLHQRWRSECDGSYICYWQEQLGSVCYNRDLTDWLNTRQPNWSLFFKQVMHHNQVDWEPSLNDHEQKSRATAPCLFAGDEITKL